MLDPEFFEPVFQPLEHLVLGPDRIGCVGDVDSRFEERSPQQAGQCLVWGLLFDKALRL